MLDFLRFQGFEICEISAKDSLEQNFILLLGGFWEFFSPHGFFNF